MRQRGRIRASRTDDITDETNFILRARIRRRVQGFIPRKHTTMIIWSSKRRVGITSVEFFVPVSPLYTFYRFLVSDETAMLCEIRSINIKQRCKDTEDNAGRPTP